MRLSVFDALRLDELCSQATTRLPEGLITTDTPGGVEARGLARAAHRRAGGHAMEERVA
jgi:hypothetical protein